MLVVHCMHLDSTSCSYLTKKNFVDLDKIISFVTHTYYEVIRTSYSRSMHIMHNMVLYDVSIHYAHSTLACILASMYAYS